MDSTGKKFEPALHAREESATVLFVDAVGFSAASLTRSPMDAFRELKSMHDCVTRLIRKHGGIVDRSLGDGLLAYFTANDDASLSGNHADHALACGVEILSTQIQNMLDAAATPPAFVLPLRIGINSGSVYIGDLGSEDRSDFTIIGSAVNFGQRLETACEINRIMIGEATMAMATLFSAKTPGMHRRPIIAKSYHEPVPAFEYDPFGENSKASLTAITAYRDFAKIARSEEREPCDTAGLVLTTSHGFANALNVSRSGILIRLETYQARGTSIRVESVIAGYEHISIPQIIVEVRWGAPEMNGTFAHGCAFKLMDEEQKAALWEIWQGALGKTRRLELA